MIDKYKYISTSRDLAKGVSKEEYDRLCNLASKERGYILKGRENIYTDMITQRAIERVFCGSIYKNESLENKTILVAQIVFPNTKSFLASVSSSSNVGAETIISLSRYFKKSKDLAAKEEKTQEEVTTINNIDSYFTWIAKKMVYYYGNVNPIAYICKANEIAAFDSELLFDMLDTDKVIKKRVKKNDN